MRKYTETDMKPNLFENPIFRGISVGILLLLISIYFGRTMVYWEYTCSNCDTYNFGHGLGFSGTLAIIFFLLIGYLTATSLAWYDASKIGGASVIKYAEERAYLDGYLDKHDGKLCRLNKWKNLEDIDKLFIVLKIADAYSIDELKCKLGHDTARELLSSIGYDSFQMAAYHLNEWRQN